MNEDFNEQIRTAVRKAARRRKRHRNQLPIQFLGLNRFIKKKTPAPHTLAFSIRFAIDVARSLRIDVDSAYKLLVLISDVMFDRLERGLPIAFPGSLTLYVHTKTSLERKRTLRVKPAISLGDRISQCPLTERFNEQYRKARQDLIEICERFGGGLPRRRPDGDRDESGGRDSEFGADPNASAEDDPRDGKISWEEALQNPRIRGRFRPHVIG